MLTPGRELFFLINKDPYLQRWSKSILPAPFIAVQVTLPYGAVDMCTCICRATHLWFLVLTSNISSRQTSMRQWPAGGCCWESSWRKVFNFCTRSLLYLGTVRHSASSGSWAGDRACGGATGTLWSFTCVGWLWRLEWCMERISIR